ncbi:N-acetyl-gamma-glutamyl-phosphate reductase [Croceicoccus hydrothermalis]|uniref:N-acetyl-gamma-glutamyl-phosphate reductase n=1 Tax=Croceicoccus hydrothermalis TaxID=2867964 RepID=UPI001EFC16DA|nr:N-acetyl-gamma-glutamyl-phosphate reductase [Croceicoccus hydrothermalis]
MSVRVFIDGAAWTTGLEIAERLTGRSGIEMIALPDDRRKDDAARAEALNDCDIAILCLPDDAARESVAMIRNDTTRVIDASTAHRVADGWTYGFAELVGHAAIAGARFVSNPGCYPTGFLALVAPLVAGGLLPADFPFVCHAVSGYSGGGKAMIADYRNGENPPAFRGYALHGGHKHLPEMQKHAGLTHAPVFAPAVVPTMRGMVVEVPIPAAAMAVTADADAMRAALRERYAGSPIVTVTLEDKDRAALLLDGEGGAHDGIVLHVFASADGTQIRLAATLDNLGKGASGAALQNLNIMAGFDEATGLNLAE